MVSEENQNDWIHAIQSETNFEMKRNIVNYLSWNLKKEKCFDLPCYAKPVAQEDFWNKIFRAAKHPEWKGDVELVEIIAPLTDNPNAPNDYGNTPIYKAACNGYTEIVKILAPLTDNPNIPNKDGSTPFAVAKNTEIQEILKTYIN